MTSTDYTSPSTAGRADFDFILGTFTLRQFDPTEQVWRIWWTSTKAVGLLDPPLEGRFVDGAGEFGCDDVIAPRAVKVRFDWTQPGWAQSFSFDSGATWQLNPVMDFPRAV